MLTYIDITHQALRMTMTNKDNKTPKLLKDRVNKLKKDPTIENKPHIEV